MFNCTTFHSFEIIITYYWGAGAPVFSEPGQSLQSPRKFQISHCFWPFWTEIPEFKPIIFNAVFGREGKEWQEGYGFISGTRSHHRNSTSYQSILHHTSQYHTPKSA